MRALQWISQLVGEDVDDVDVLSPQPLQQQIPKLPPDVPEPIVERPQSTQPVPLAPSAERRRASRRLAERLRPPDNNA